MTTRSSRRPLPAFAATMLLALAVAASTAPAALAQSRADRNAVFDTCLALAVDLRFCHCVADAAMDALDDESAPHFAEFLRAAETGAGEAYLAALDGRLGAGPANRVRERVVGAVFSVQTACEPAQ